MGFAIQSSLGWPDHQVINLPIDQPTNQPIEQPTEKLLYTMSHPFTKQVKKKLQKGTISILIYHCFPYSVSHQHGYFSDQPMCICAIWYTMGNLKPHPCSVHNRYTCVKICDCSIHGYDAIMLPESAKNGQSSKSCYSLCLSKTTMPHRLKE